MYIDNAIHIEHNGIDSESRWIGFTDAAVHSVRTDYMVDDVVVQKYYAGDAARYSDDPFTQGMSKYDIGWTYYARVKVAGGWYRIDGEDEADVDAIATALAHIAAQYERIAAHYEYDLRHQLIPQASSPAVKLY